MEELKPNGQRAKYATLLIWAVLAMDIISIVSYMFQYNLIRDAGNGGTITTETAEANDNRVQIIAIVYLVIFIISAITFILWFRRAYFNLHLKTKTLTFLEGWAAGAWFVPIVNLYRPYQIMKELYDKTIELLNQKGLLLNTMTTRFLGWWWTFWILNNIAEQIVYRYSKIAITIEQLTNSTILSMAKHCIGIPLALLAIKVIHDYSKLEPLMDDLYDETDEAIYNSLLPPEEN